MNKNKEIKSEFLIITSIILFCFLYTIIINKEIHLKGFMNIMSFFTSCVYLSSFIVLLQTKGYHINNFYRYLSVGFVGVGILNINYMIILQEGIEKFDVMLRLHKTYYLQSFYEVLVFMFSLYFCNKLLKMRNLIFIYATLVLIISYSEVTFNSTSKMYAGIFVSTLLDKIIMILYIMIIDLLRKNKDKIAEKVYKNFLIYTWLKIIIFLFITLTSKWYTIERMTILYLFGSFNQYYIFKTIIIEVIKNPHETLYNELVQKKQLLENTILELEKRNNEDRIKSQLLANISHEFKTPVNVIYSALQIQELKKNSNDINEILKFNHIMRKNCFRLIRLINNFIDSTKFKEKEVALDFKCMNIVEVVEDVTMSVLAFSETKGIDIVFDTYEEKIFVLGDRDLIERAILNILSNSIKYSSEQGKIKVVISSENKKVIIQVIDNGVGISQEKQKVIFNRFERGDDSTKRQNEGSGLGLSIVKEIINLHNGDIKVYSREGVGTKISIFLEKYHGEYIYDMIAMEDNNLDKLESKVELELSDIY